jgi:transposase InsO family protein
VAPPHALTLYERPRVVAVLSEPRFVDLAPARVYATLFDEGTYYCAARTMYRVLAAHYEVHERRRQRRAPIYGKPEQLATVPNQLWGRDITKLRGPQPGTWYHLYVVLDVFSRWVVGWLVELGIAKSHSRLHVSNDNPYSEARFKPMKYRPNFPGRFGSREDAHTFLVDSFRWYKAEHRHRGLGPYTPYVRSPSNTRGTTFSWRPMPSVLIASSGDHPPQLGHSNFIHAVSQTH